MSEGGFGPGAQAVVVLCALAAFALATTAAVVAVGVGPIADVVPNSSDSVPDQPGDVVDDGEAADATVSGRVAAPDGGAAANATVVVAEHPESLFANATPSELASVVDGESGADLWTARTAVNGSFAVDVPDGEYDVIAFRDGNVSRVRTVEVSGATVVPLSLREDRRLAYRASGETVAPGENATVAVAVYNRDDDAATASVSFFPLPSGWTVVGFEGSASRVVERSRTFAFENVSAGALARAELVVHVPENATRGETYAIGASASRPIGEDGSGVVRWRGSADVVVAGNGTSTSAESAGSSGDAASGGGDGASGDGEGATASAASTSDDSALPSLPGRTVPGFGVALALAATTLVIAAVAARQQA
ncbi:hypothetical protein G9C85_11215 [Halorubellus sp. JP-L1]|uniref:hypothetical protein n=1 Tax=Halorubellus sp. JP-L1 TaxID=2715753 RepID=UPI001408DD60|nr:hypothetical protein [Halorubellus sp. JP-L1]NHN42191.1 hypothetical protein [Halorubellus sp. JP-L1]